MTEKMIIETDRLVLRRFCKEDLQDLYEYLSDEETVRFEPYHPMDMNEVKANLDWKISTDEMIAVELKSIHKLIGNVYLGKRECNSLELGYVFNRQFWGQGYAGESCTALIRKAFQKESTGYMLSVTRVIQHHGNCWKDQVLPGRLISGKIYSSGRTKTITRSGRTHLYMAF